MVCIRVHTWWPAGSDPFYQANVAENTARTNFYQPASKYVPRAFIDGIIDGQWLYNTWGNFIRGRAIVDALVDMQLEGYYLAPNGMVTVLAQATGFLSFSDLRIVVFITEDGIPYAAKTWNQVMRDMIPSSNGDPVTLNSPGDSLVREYDFTIDGAWVADSCNVVVLIQDWPTKEILQSEVVRVSTLPGVEEVEARRSATLFALSPAYPNPFGDRARIEYAIPSNGRVELHIYDSSGSLVRTLVRGWESAGKHMEYWDGKDDRGREVASGVYFSRLSYEGNARTSKMSLVR